MKLKIGKNEFETKMITADFPIRFYKETGMDIFGLEDEDKSFMERYELALRLAHALCAEDLSLEEFAANFTPVDLVAAYTDIFECYMETTTPKVESETEKKQQ